MPPTGFPPEPTGEPGLQGQARRGWTFRPAVRVEEAYTDNVRLAPQGSERSDWVTTVRPSFILSNYGPRLRLDLSYAPQLIYRAREETRDVFHYLSGSGTAAVVSDLLYVDAQAYLSRQNASLLGPQAESDVNLTGNRTSVRGYNVSPYLRRDFGSQARGELRYSRSAVEYGTSSLFSSEADRVDALLASGPAYKRLTWNLAYIKDHIRYTETGQTVDLQRGTVGLRRLITPTLGVLANAGYEENTYRTAGPAPEGKLWSIGPEWTPTPRTRLAVTTGRRFFGRTHFLDFSHRTRLTVWQVDYNEDVTTGRSEVLVPVTFDTATYFDTLLTPRIPDPLARQTAVQSLMEQTGLPAQLSAPVNYITAVPFVQKRLRASVAVNGVRNTIVVHGYRQTRDLNEADAAVTPAGSGDLLLTPRTIQTGAGASWSLRVSPLLTSTVSVDLSRNEFPALDREDNIASVRVGLVKEFQPRLSGFVSYRHLRNDSNRAGADYRENAVIVGVRMRF